MDSGKKTINHVEIRKILPVQDGYRMPGEYEPHRGCILIWPEGFLRQRPTMPGPEMWDQPL